MVGRGKGKKVGTDEWVEIRIPTERDEQEELVKWLLYKYPRLVFFSIPNEGKRTDYMRFHMAATGLLAGVPDLLLLTYPQPTFVEMKRAKGGVLSPKQKEVIGWIRAIGFKVLVCYGLKDAIEQLEPMLSKHFNTIKSNSKITRKGKV